MPSSPSRWIVLLMFGALSAFGCVGSDTGDAGESGSLALDLVIGDGIVINEVQWRITGNGMDMSGSIDVSAPGATASVEVFGLPVGDEEYTVELTALSDDEEVACKGSMTFNVMVGETTDVMVVLNCKLPETLGSVRVNGKFNICAQLTKATAAPLQTSVGNDIDLTSEAQDAEGDEIHYIWTATGGSIADPSAPSTTYTCQEAGDQTITIQVTDNDEYCNMATWTFPVACVPSEAECQTDEECGSGEVCVAGQCVPDAECDVDADCDDENQCTVDICADGTCSNPNQQADFTCDQDGGAVCDGNGNCVECIADAQCAVGEVCTDNACVADVECMMDSECADENQCTADVCNVGECANPNEEPGASCDQLGGSVCDGQGNCVECNTDADCGMGEVCTNNACEADVECTMGSECEDGNQCTADTCASGMCSNPNEPADTACTDGGSVCDGQGSCVECNDALQCPGGGECQVPACESNACGLNNAPDGAACNDDTGTCMAGVCEAAPVCEYVQDFESLDANSATALIDDGWLFFANVFDGAGNFKFPFGPFGAPNATVSPSNTFISAVVTGEGDVPQGAQQLSVFNDYNCCQPNQGHFNGTDRVQINVFQEINPIPGSFIGQTLTFSFDAKRGNIEGATTALAFITTLDPSTGFSQTNFVPIDLSDIPATWNRYSITLDLTDGALEGQILQVGFRNTAGNFEGSGIFYDNVEACLTDAVL